MESSILKGDFIIGSKLHYGPRFPMTPLSIPFFHQKLNASTSSYSTGIQFDYFRLPGFSNVKRYDAIIFNYPEETEHPTDQRTYYVKRAIGLPGDTLKILSKKVFIGDELLPDPIDLQYNYILYPGKGFDEKVFHQLGISQYQWISAHNLFQIATTTENANYLKKKEFVKSLKRVTAPRFSRNDFIYPQSEKFKWNLDNFGPVIIPKRGLTIVLDSNNFLIYQKAIAEFENHEVSLMDNEVYIDGKLTDTYTFEMDYYFVLGDNRGNSSDSRFWGFVPESHLVGKAFMTVYSMNSERQGFLKQVRWDRFFKSID